MRSSVLFVWRLVFHQGYTLVKKAARGAKKLYKQTEGACMRCVLEKQAFKVKGNIGEVKIPQNFGIALSNTDGYLYTKVDAPIKKRTLKRGADLKWSFGGLLEKKPKK